MSIDSRSCEIAPSRYRGIPLTVSVFQHWGDRPTQEDRFTVVPNLEPEIRLPCSFFGVFDGTVGDFASDSVKDLVVPMLLQSPSWRGLRNLLATHSRDALEAQQERLLADAVRDMYMSADESLLLSCAKDAQNYATCTSVTLVVVGDLLAVGHLGDSRIVLGKEVDGRMVGELMTTDHKPDNEQERQRIEESGGAVVRLRNHGAKPFIRGGDFMVRNASGDRPMQLQYSRAFGCKDLKCFGLSSVPDVRLLRIGDRGSPAYRHVRYAILASDGLWDVVDTQRAVQIAHQAVQEGRSPSEAVVRCALHEQWKRKARSDNITAVCVQFDNTGVRAV
jgi:protein phosphatase